MSDLNLLGILAPLKEPGKSARPGVKDRWRRDSTINNITLTNPVPAIPQDRVTRRKLLETRRRQAQALYRFALFEKLSPAERLTNAIDRAQDDALAEYSLDALGATDSHDEPIEKNDNKNEVEKKSVKSEDPSKPAKGEGPKSLRKASAPSEPLQPFNPHRKTETNPIDDILNASVSLILRHEQWTEVENLPMHSQQQVLSDRTIPLSRLLAIPNIMQTLALTLVDTAAQQKSKRTKPATYTFQRQPLHSQPINDETHQIDLYKSFPELDKSGRKAAATAWLKSVQIIQVLVYQGPPNYLRGPEFGVVETAADEKLDERGFMDCTKDYERWLTWAMGAGTAGLLRETGKTMAVLKIVVTRKEAD